MRLEQGKIVDNKNGIIEREGGEKMNINYVAVLLAAVANVVVGSLWYSPMLFAKQWMKLSGQKEMGMKGGSMFTMYGMTTLAALIEAYVLAMFMRYVGATTVSEGLMVAAWAWVGFTAATALPNYVFGGRPRNLYILDMGYHLVAILAMGAVIAAVSL